MHYLHKLAIVSAGALGATALLIPLLAWASTLNLNPFSNPFGGTVVSVLPCLTAPGFFAVDVLEPPFDTLNTYILSMTSPYLSHVPPHPGQHVLGKTTGMYSCIIDLNPKHYIVWVDPVSVFYGSNSI